MRRSACVAKSGVAKKRVGARKVAEVPAKVLQELEAGKLETANLVESLAVDQFALAGNVLPSLGLQSSLLAVQEMRSTLKKTTIVQVISLMGRALASQASTATDRKELLRLLANHPSDMVRNWGAATVGEIRHSSWQARLTAIKPFADDTHFGVREIAWMAIRPNVAEDLEAAFEGLMLWAESPRENLRRFASELTRPRGVWCKHLDELKANPGLALPLLEMLRSDPSKYVRDSVGNWLNDAAKSQPAWVKSICRRWRQESATVETEAILKRAMRSL